MTCLGLLFGSGHLRHQHWKAWTMSGNTTDAISRLCIQYCTRPRLGTLSRCGDCVRVAAEEDRQSRQSPETRVASKRIAREAEARAAAERQVALEKLGDAFIEFASSPEGARFRESQHAALVAPRNDPEYVNSLIANDEMRQSVANEVTLVTHAVEWGRNRIGLTLRNDRDHATAREGLGSSSHCLRVSLSMSRTPTTRASLRIAARSARQSTSLAARLDRRSGERTSVGQ